MLTVGELKKILADLDDAMFVVLAVDVAKDAEENDIVSGTLVSHEVETDPAGEDAAILILYGEEGDCSCDEDDQEPPKVLS